MALTSAQQETVEQFRATFRARYASDPRFSNIADADRDDGAWLMTRFAVADRLWLELCVRPSIPQVRVGIMTDDRWISEELEDAIEETGDSMSEFVESGFDEVGLDCPEPTVEHYRDQGKYYYFATALELGALDELGTSVTLDRVARMIDGYYEAFRKAIAKTGQEA